jgi:hypothetical protein
MDVNSGQRVRGSIGGEVLMSRQLGWRTKDLLESSIVTSAGVVEPAAGTWRPPAEIAPL